MPSIVGPIKVNSVSSSGELLFGDVLNLSPENNAKSYAGSGSLSTGDIQTYTHCISLTNVLDPDVVDEIMIKNN